MSLVAWVRTLRLYFKTMMDNDILLMLHGMQWSTCQGNIVSWWDGEWVHLHRLLLSCASLAPAFVQLPVSMLVLWWISSVLESWNITGTGVFFGCNGHRKFGNTTAQGTGTGKSKMDLMKTKTCPQQNTT